MTQKNYNKAEIQLCHHKSILHLVIKKQNVNVKYFYYISTLYPQKRESFFLYVLNHDVTLMENLWVNKKKYHVSSTIH